MKAAQAQDVISAKGGLDAEVEQSGRNFSGGQRQRLTIARALVRKPEILILDDSASALDFATDARLRMAIRQLPYRPTVFIVSQRASSVRYADQIIVLDDGRIAGLGTHEQLLEGCTVYREIFDSQYRRRGLMNMKTERFTRCNTLRRVLNIHRAFAGATSAISLLFATVSVALTLYLPVLSGDAIDLLIGAGKVDFGALNRILVRMIFVILATALAQWLMSAANNRITYRTVRDIRADAFAHLQRLPLSYLDAHPSGDIVSRVIADVDTFSDGLLMGFTQLFTGVLTILGTLLFMLRISVGTTVFVVLATPISLFVAAFIAKKTYTMFKLQTGTRGEQTALINEMIGGQKVVEAFGQEENVLEKFDAVNARLQKFSLRATFFSSLTNPCTRFVNSLVYAGVAVFGSLSAITSYSGITVGQLACFFDLCQSVYQAV